MFPIASTLGMSNSAYSLMQGPQRARNLAFSGNANTNNLAAVYNAETMNMLGMIQDRTMYKMQDVAYDSNKALQDKNIKRTFSTFA